MNTSNSRKYISPAREQQALATRKRILDAAEKLLKEKDFIAMTVTEVARRAAVSPQTVYAVFASKAGILAAVIEDRIMQDERNVDAIKLLHTSHDPELQLRSIAKLLRNIHDQNRDTFAAVYGARVVSRELAHLEDELGNIRRQKQYPIAASLHKSGKLMPGLSVDDVCDILWTLTSREIYYLFVVKRGWSIERYEEQLHSMLVSSLIGREALPLQPTSTSSTRR